MSNDSSYTVLTEDGVEISSLEFSDNNQRDTEIMEEPLYITGASKNVENDSSKMQSFSFEAQVNNFLNSASLSNHACCDCTKFLLIVFVISFFYTFYFSSSTQNSQNMV